MPAPALEQPGKTVKVDVVVIEEFLAIPLDRPACRRLGAGREDHHGQPERSSKLTGEPGTGGAAGDKGDDTTGAPNKAAELQPIFHRAGHPDRACTTEPAHYVKEGRPGPTP